jgi:hypothetical protein
MSKNISPVELANRWGIPYIVDASNHEVWKETFMALGTATYFLDEKENEIGKLFEKLSLLKDEIEIYAHALTLAATEFNFDVDNILLEAERTI